ncbi:MAG: DUF1499 domain-containing protein [Nitrosomonas sp.]|jgi:uncharacterized protein (DUF1499 family)|nr:DUF1499 domain-containing protein [Nitrosomonas sp.]
MLLIKWLAIIIFATAVLMIVVGQLGFFRGNPPDDLGVREGRLKPPAPTPNSVSSQTGLYPEHPQQDYASIAPLEVDLDGEAMLARIKTVVAATPGAQIIENTSDYLYARFTTPTLKFVDDVEFWFDPGMNVIHVRSASRLGKSDLGVNRRRIEAIRSALQPLSENNSD